jgi:hydroxymethylbilane synthase
VLDALARGACDVHVCGARELPIELPAGVLLAACTERTDPFDVLLTRDGALLEELPAGAVLGVESARVRVQIARFRDDLEVRLVPTGVESLWTELEKGELAGFLAAAEDVEILGWQASVSEVFPPDIVLPAAGQGSLAVLVRDGDAAGLEIARTLDHRVTHRVVDAERAFLRELGVGPAHPVAVHGRFDGDTLVLEALLADEVSGAVLRDDLDGSPEEGADLGVRLAKLVLADGARDYLAGYR